VQRARLPQVLQWRLRPARLLLGLQLRAQVLPVRQAGQ
jgi:hypothetical protein